jgi:hypothetical protein
MIAARLSRPSRFKVLRSEVQGLKHGAWGKGHGVKDKDSI